MYPSLFLLATNPNSTVEQIRSGNTWDVHFRRNMEDWELYDVFDLLGRSNSCTVDSQALTEGDGAVPKRFLVSIGHNPRVSRKPLKVETFGKSAKASRTSSK
ncbi:hypothetical protein H5410_060640 [Solanum commersonii]|uniref:Uncharacterized protein n=1 Tax=Solanum commersonii TaxID=4109 RepID=A0A9J5W5S8_SOLCO|nr:hypothetical protein H5410_060640 [Solanum commersonii]